MRRMELAEFVEHRAAEVGARWSACWTPAEAGRALKSLSLDDARALSRLYRATSSDLLWVRARAGAADVSGYLNDLVGRAYALTYPGKRVRLGDVGALRHPWASPT